MKEYPLTAEEVWDRRAELDQVEAKGMGYLYIGCSDTSIYQNCDSDCNCAEETFHTKEQWLGYFKGDMFREVP